MKSAFSLLFIAFNLICPGQSGSEIFLYDLTVTNGVVRISNGKNITNHRGYDNQPYFHPSKPFIYYASFDDSGRSDIRWCDFKRGTNNELTKTHAREYSPTVTPDGAYISCIIQGDSGAQDLGKYPVNGGKPLVLVDDLVVGYHAWIDSRNLLLFVLGDSGRHTLRDYDLDTKTNRILETGIGRSLHRIPGRNTMSFVRIVKDSSAEVCEYDPSTGTISSLVPALPGSDHLCWLKEDIILMSDNTGIFYRPPGKNGSWQRVMIEGSPQLKGATRLAVNAENTRIALWCQKKTK